MNLLARAGVAALFIGLSTTAAVAAPATSPSPSPSPSAAPAEIGRTVTTSDRLAEPIGRTSRPTFVVDRAHIDAYGARAIGDALVDVPGTNLFSYGGFGAQINYGLRGTSSNDTLVLLNGVPITAASNGVVDLGTLPTLGVSRIEVVESGGSTLYGTSATGGVINLITGAPAQPYARVSAGSLGDRDAVLGAGAGGFSAFVERHVVTNDYAYPAFAYTQSTAFPAGTRSNADVEQTAARVGWDGDFGGTWHLRANAGEDAYHLGAPGSFAFGLSTVARQNQNRGNADLTLEHRGTRDTFSLTLSGSTQNLVFDDPDNGNESDTLDRRVGLSLKDVRAWNGGDLVAGVDLARENALLTFGDFGGAPASASQAQSAAYVQYGADLAHNARLTFGVRGEHDAPIGSVIVPSVGGIVSLGAARISANYGSTFRVPSIVDLDYPGFSNPDLKPERVRNADATIAFPTVAGGLSLGYFNRHGTNLIVFDANFLPQNAGHTAVEGLLLTAATRSYHHLRASASITDTYRATNTDTGERLMYTPATRATVALDRAFDGGRFALGARALVVGANRPQVPGQIATPDAYTTADAYLRYRFGPQTILTARVRNAGDERYVPIYGYPAPGRTFSLELATR